MLARDLGKTVAQMRTQMSNQEFVRWQNFYAREAQLAELERAKGR